MEPSPEQWKRKVQGRDEKAEFTPMSKTSLSQRETGYNQLDRLESLEKKRTHRRTLTSAYKRRKRDDDIRGFGEAQAKGKLEQLREETQQLKYVRAEMLQNFRKFYAEIDKK